MDAWSFVLGQSQRQVDVMLAMSFPLSDRYCYALTILTTELLGLGGHFTLMPFRAYRFS